MLREEQTEGPGGLIYHLVVLKGPQLEVVRFQCLSTLDTGMLILISVIYAGSSWLVSILVN